MFSKILFLCTGNTCRSPLAELQAIEQFVGLNCQFESAGLDAAGGQPASDGSLMVARHWGLSLDDFYSKPVSRVALTDVAWVIGMTRSHAAIFRSRYGVGLGGKIGVLGAPGVDLAQVRFSEPAEEIDDPHGCSDEIYLAAGEQIKRLVANWRPVFKNLTIGEGA